jgi:CRP-like cAMP-binding protein
MTTQSPSAKAVVRWQLVQRLSRFVSLSSAEIAVLEELQSTTRVVRHNREIITQGRRYGGLLVTIEGISVRYRILRDGRRQALDIALPGDLIGFPACFFDSAPYSISALTDTVLACIPFPVLGGLFKTQPRLAAAIFWSFAAEAAIYIEHLTDVGRRSSALPTSCSNCWCGFKASAAATNVRSPCR